MGGLRKYIAGNRSLMTCALLLLVAVAFYLAVYVKAVFIDGIGNPHLFFHPDNIANLLGQAAIVGTLACAMTLVIVSGHIDLSAGSLLGMLGALCSTLILDRGPAGIPALPAILIVVAVGAALGSFHGYLVIRFGIPAFIVTLGGLMVYRGVLLLLAKSTIPMQSDFINSLGSAALPDLLSLVLAGAAGVVWFFISLRRPQGLKGAGALVSLAAPLALFMFVLWLSQGDGIPVRFAVMLGLGLALHLFSARFKQGRYIYAIGGNSQAALYSGINIRFYTILVFALMGMAAAVAGILSTGIQMASEASAGDLMELYAIAACVIGGCSLRGGKGSVFAAVLGSLIMATIRNGLSCLGVGSAGEKIVLGVILVVAVAIDLKVSGNSGERA